MDYFKQQDTFLAKMREDYENGLINIKALAPYELGVEEIMVVAHSHCGACHMSFDHFRHEMTARGVTDETLDTIGKCGIDLHHWLEGFKDTPTSVKKTVETIKTHPLVPKDIVVRGFIIDSETGELEEV